MKCASALFILSTVAVLCQEVVSLEFSPEVKEKHGPEKFVPTTEWQRVQKGQPLPAGLHYRININTGETEAKLLETTDTTDHDKSKTDLVAVDSQDDADNPENSLYMSKDELKRVLSDITADDEDSGLSEDNQKIKDSFRSYEDLKREFGTMNISVKTDMEILNDLVQKGKEIITHSDTDVIVTNLKDLEYLVHQIDNAREFIRLGGLNYIIVPALNSTSPSVRAEALWLLGSAVQSNPKIAVLNGGIMPSLVKAVVLDSDVVVHARAIYALSCLTRQFPAAQAKLVAEGGLASLSGIIDSKRSTDFKTQMRVITLINDLLLERIYVRRAFKEVENQEFRSENQAVQKIQQHKQAELKEKLRQYDAINLEKRLVEDGWCQRLSEFLWMLYESGTNSGRTQRRDDLGSVVSKDVPYRPEHDSVEKVIGTIHAMKDLCGDTFQGDLKLEEVLKQFLSWYNELSIREEVIKKQPPKVECGDGSKNCLDENEPIDALDADDMYYSTIAETLKELLEFIKQRRLNTKEEL